MEGLITTFTSQLRKAVALAGGLEIVQRGKAIRQVVVAGMGGSGIGASMVAALINDEAKVPFAVSKGYDIPGYVGPETLFIACSYSGNTEETLAAVEKAIAKQAQVICLTSGGRLRALSEEAQLLRVDIPAESDSPRAMIGYQLVLLLAALHRMNLIDGTFIAQTKDGIARLDDEAASIKEKAVVVARQIQGKLPIIYSGNHLYPMAVRFQNQLNENGKHLAHVNTFPEMNHNEIVGWRFPEPVLRQSQVIFLLGDNDHERERLRMSLCEEVFEQHSSLVITLQAAGNSRLEQFLYLIHLTDWISWYVAAEKKVDATAIEVIDRLKDQLSKQ